MLHLQKTYEAKIKALENQVTKMDGEKRKMALKDKDALKEDGREKQNLLTMRLETLKKELHEAKSQQKEFKRLQKLHSRGELKISSLQVELSGMKATRAGMQRELKSKTELYRKTTRAKDLEIVKLKRSEARQEYQLHKLEDARSKQSNVLKRKTEEIAMAHKKLKTAQLKSLGKREKTFTADHEEALRLQIHQLIETNVTIADTKCTITAEMEARKAISKKATSVLVQKQLQEKSKSVKEMQSQLMNLESSTRLCFSSVTAPSSITIAKHTIAHFVSLFVETRMESEIQMHALKQRIEDLEAVRQANNTILLIIINELLLVTYSSSYSNPQATSWF